MAVLWDHTGALTLCEVFLSHLLEPSAVGVLNYQLELIKTLMRGLLGNL